jgi:hypothetical protein
MLIRFNRMSEFRNARSGMGIFGKIRAMGLRGKACKTNLTAVKGTR